MRREVLVQARELVLHEEGKVVGREPLALPERSFNESLQRLIGGRTGPVNCARVACVHARLFLLPWLHQLKTSERWNALAVSRFEQLFGEAADNWQMRVADDVPPRSRLAVALPAALVRALTEALKPRRILLGALDALGLLLSREPRYHGCVAEIGSNNACLFMLWNGDLRRVRSRRFDAASQVLAAARSEWAAASAASPRGTRTVKASEGARPPSLAVMGMTSMEAAELAAALGSSRVVELGERAP